MAVPTPDDRSSAGNSAIRSGRTGRQVSRLEQANTELLARLEKRDAELEAARAANREPARARLKIATWITGFYTPRRRHSAAGGLPPEEFERIISEARKQHGQKHQAA